MCTFTPSGLKVKSWKQRCTTDEHFEWEEDQGMERSAVPAVRTSPQKRAAPVWYARPSSKSRPGGAGAARAWREHILEQVHGAHLPVQALHRGAQAAVARVHVRRQAARVQRLRHLRPRRNLTGTETLTLS